MIRYLLLVSMNTTSQSKPRHHAVAKHLQCQKGAKPLSLSLVAGFTFSAFRHSDTTHKKPALCVGFL
jgi:hypothetical protein